MSVGATGFGNRTQVQPEFGDDQTSYNVGEGPYSGHGDSKYGSGAVSIQEIVARALQNEC